MVFRLLAVPMVPATNPQLPLLRVFSLASKYSLIVSPRVEFYLKVVALVRFASLFASCFRELFRKLLTIRFPPGEMSLVYRFPAYICFCFLDYAVILLSVLAPQALLFPLKVSSLKSN